MKILILILAILIWCGEIQAAQSAFHCLTGHYLNSSISEYVFAKKDYEIYTAPVSGIASHMIADRFVGEGGLDFQIELGLVRILIMWMSVPDSKKDLFLWESFWSMAPDIIDKLGKTNYFHQSDQGYLAVNSGLTNICEEFSILLFQMNF